jgi:hypothetical protein
VTTPTSEKFYERYMGMPIPPVKENMTVFPAGAVSIGVEFRVLTDAVVGALGLKEIAASNDYPHLDDRGVSLHVFVKTPEGNFERLRFDCFQQDPHYHYLSLKNKWQDVIHIDTHANGDPVAWSLNLIRTRLAAMLTRAEVEDAFQYVDAGKLDEVLPRVTEAAYRARYNSNAQHIEESAMQRVGAHQWETHAERDWATHSQL